MHYVKEPSNLHHDHKQSYASSNITFSGKTFFLVIQFALSQVQLWGKTIRGKFKIKFFHIQYHSHFYYLRTSK